MPDPAIPKIGLGINVACKPCLWAMVRINLAMAIEQYKLESEVSPAYEEPVAGGKL